MSRKRRSRPQKRKVKAEGLMIHFEEKPMKESNKSGEECLTEIYEKQAELGKRRRLIVDKEMDYKLRTKAEIEAHDKALAKDEKEVRALYKKHDDFTKQISNLLEAGRPEVLKAEIKELEKSVKAEKSEAKKKELTEELEKKRESLKEKETIKVHSDFKQFRDNILKGGAKSGAETDLAQYTTPDQTKIDIKQIKADREELTKIGKKHQPTETFYIEKRKSKHNWKPYRIETYGITEEELREIFEKKRAKREPIEIGSIHGANHSEAELVKLEESGNSPDFYVYSDLPQELPNEKDYVKYYAREVYDVPLVILNFDDPAEKFYQTNGIFPKASIGEKGGRWCTRYWKTTPINYLYKDLAGKEETVIIQHLGIMEHQSSKRAELKPMSISYLSNDKLTVLDSLPIHKGVEAEGKEPLEVSDNYIKKAIEKKGKKYIQNPNEAQFGRHGCITCPFASMTYYECLKCYYPDMYDYTIELRDSSSEKRIKESYQTALDEDMTEKEAKEYSELSRWKRDRKPFQSMTKKNMINYYYFFDTEKSKAELKREFGVSSGVELKEKYDKIKRDFKKQDKLIKTQNKIKAFEEAEKQLIKKGGELPKKLTEAKVKEIKKEYGITLPAKPSKSDRVFVEKYDIVTKTDLRLVEILDEEAKNDSRVKLESDNKKIFLFKELLRLRKAKELSEEDQELKAILEKDMQLSKIAVY